MIDYFFDPVLRAPTIGSMLMCLSSALVGVLVYLRRESLLGEALSHATYPGVVIGVLFAAPWIGESSLAIAVLFGATLSALIAMGMIYWMKHNLKVSSDAALCFVLAGFFGIGVLIASRVQFTHTELYLKMRAYIYGQPATMTDQHVMGYAFLACVVILPLILLRKELEAHLFDRDYAKSLGLPVKLIDTVLVALLVFAVVVGIRAVGVVLMSAMLIAPAVAARQLTHRMQTMLIVAGGIGTISGFLGNYLSVEIPDWVAIPYLILPTGPMIVLVASLFCFLTLLFAAERGLLGKLLRLFSFRARCIQENVMKTIWREQSVVSIETLMRWQKISRLRMQLLLWRLGKKGWVMRSAQGYALTTSGEKEGARLIRLHRLWEVYLAECLGVKGKRVHNSAEEMDHVLTPELEEELTRLLRDPKTDPHQQPIPPRCVEERS